MVSRPALYHSLFITTAIVIGLSSSLLGTSQLCEAAIDSTSEINALNASTDTSLKTSDVNVGQEQFAALMPINNADADSGSALLLIGASIIGFSGPLLRKPKSE